MYISAYMLPFPCYFFLLEEKECCLKANTASSRFSFKVLEDSVGFSFSCSLSSTSADISYRLALKALVT